MKRIAYARPDGGLSVVVPALGSRRVTAVTVNGERWQFSPPIPAYKVIRAARRALVEGGDPQLAKAPDSVFLEVLEFDWAETESEFIERISKRCVPPDAENVTVCDESDIPSDRTFREAWECSSGRVAVNMDKAREIHMDRIRKVRDRELAKLDVEYQRADERGDATAKAQVAARKQALRDIPQTFDLTQAKTPEELKALWPEGLPRE